MTSISAYLNKDLVAFLDVDNRDEVLRSLVDIVEAAGYLEDTEEFFEAILAREKVVSTGIGMGVAIPHAKLPHYEQFFIAIGILKQGIEWNAIDGVPVRLVFLIGGPDYRQSEYLKILSCLTLAIKDEARRKKMLNLTTPEDIINLFE